MEVREEPNGAVVSWQGAGMTFRASLPGHHEITFDEPEPIGSNKGPRPTDILLSAAAACSAISASALFKKMRQPVTGFSVQAAGDRQTDWPKAFTAIRLTFRVEVGGGYNRELLHKAIDLAVRRYCPVSGTIEMGEGGCSIDYVLEIIESE